MARTTIREEDITSGAVPTTGIVGVSTFTASGTWTKATRESALGVTISKVIVEVVGGGAGGGSGTSVTINPGSTGALAIKVVDVTGVSSATITVGGGGSATSSGGNSVWSDGTNTVTGGGGVRTNNTTGTSAGVATGGDINIPGFVGVKQEGRGEAGIPGPKGAYGGGGYAPYAINQSGTGGTGEQGIVIVWEIAG